MTVAYPNRRQLRHEVIGMRRPVDITLVGDELSQCIIAYAGTAVCVLLVSLITIAQEEHTKSMAYPSFRITVAPSVANAAPRLCPVNTI